MKNWNVRYFVIRELELFYYTDTTLNKSKGKISLNNCTVESSVVEGREQ